MLKRIKIVVLGATGLIGHQVYNWLDRNAEFELFSVAFQRKLTEETVLCDIRNEKEFISLLQKIKPNIIINCIGILISGSNKDPKSAILVNAYMPHRLMEFADSMKAKLIHISTDCVFSGRKGQYVENDEKDGLDTYAKTKGLGEIINDRHLTLRTSVVGPELKMDGEELFHWFMSQKGMIFGYINAIWSGVTTLELAKAVEWAILKNVTGLYHITNNESISKFDLLTLINHYTKKNLEILPNGDKMLDKSFIDTRKELDFSIPSYDKMIADMIAMIKKNKKIYTQYQIG